MLQRKLKEENGEVMLEAAIILVPILILLMALLSLSFFFYQEAMMNSVANEIAAEVAKNYKFTDLKMGTKDIELDDITEVKMFRMSFSKNKMEKEHQKRAEEYAKWRVNLATLGLNPGEVEVECKVTSSGIGRAYVKVTVSQKTDFFLSGILELTGITEKDTLFGATAYAECVDFMGYTSMVNFTEYGSRKLGDAGKSIGNLYNNVKDFIQKLED